MSIDILHIFGRMGRGGAEMLILDLMRHIDRQKYRFHFCALSGLPGELDQEIRDLGGEVFLMKLGKKFLWEFGDLLSRKRFDVVHSHVHLFSGAILSIAAVKSVPVRVAHFHSMKNAGGNKFIKPVQNRIMKALINRNATDVVGVCEGVMNHVWKNDWKENIRFKVIYNGLVEALRFNGEPETAQVRTEFGLPVKSNIYIHVGRMAIPKNHLRLIHIFKQILELDDDAYLLLVGKGGNEIEKNTRKAVSDLGIINRVVFVGERTDVPRLLKAADVMVFPSLWEGLPGVVLESCAATTPVVASDLAGIEEIAVKFPSYITCLPLSIDDIKWAQKLNEVCRINKNRSRKYEVRHLFEKNGFSIENQIEMMCDIWNRK